MECDEKGQMLIHTKNLQKEVTNLSTDVDQKTQRNNFLQKNLHKKEFFSEYEQYNK